MLALNHGARTSFCVSAIVQEPYYLGAPTNTFYDYNLVNNDRTPKTGPPFRECSILEDLSRDRADPCNILPATFVKRPENYKVQTPIGLAIQFDRADAFRSGEHAPPLAYRLLDKRTTGFGRNYGGAKQLGSMPFVVPSRLRTIPPPFHGVERVQLFAALVFASLLRWAFRFARFSNTRRTQARAFLAVVAKVVASVSDRVQRRVHRCAMRQGPLILGKHLLLAGNAYSSPASLRRARRDAPRSARTKGALHGNALLDAFKRKRSNVRKGSGFTRLV